MAIDTHIESNMAFTDVNVKAAAVLALILLLAWQLAGVFRRPKNFPPGPWSLPFIGNLHQIPRGLPWVAFGEWAQRWGPIVGFRLGTQDAVVLNDAALVHEVLVKNGAAMSGRPPRYVAQEHVIPEGKHVHPVFMRNDYAMRLRAVTKDYLVGAGLLKLAPMAQAIGMRLVHDIYMSYQDSSRNNAGAQEQGHVPWTDALAQWAVTTPVAVMAGAPVEAFGRDFVHNYHHTTVIFEDIMVSGAADIIPLTRYLPDWFTGWRKQAPIVRKAVLDAYGVLMRVAGQDRGGSFHGLIPALRRQAADPKVDANLRLSEPEIMVMMGGLLDAGFASTVASFETIVLSLTAHPRVLRRVQAEVDAELGTAGLPERVERGRLPYLHACIMEVLRWHATTPVPLPREAVADVQVGDYRIPKGTTVMTNVWAIQRDPAFYDDPDSFVPERYLHHPLGIKDGAPEVHRKALYTFGFGRRACPGQDFYFQQMEITMAQVIWAFDFVPTGPLDIDVTTGFVFGVASRPKPLNMKFELRRPVDVLQAEKRRADIALDQILGLG
ncbi:uncharacterized protein RCC_08521 [Ramularia collo-cygni]|uniref:Cytochrome P450 n=1 Tax=Ramularia collo-cygni TaxID=112498 RepID=A0A2D3VAZ0_9PEZI|nr:uncharacterized protein RCC_08521 [Ramularia collo-cygni]CZT22815.1 uncharacterized protein RCC_08521 [Ramularia collo-cygni]